MNSGNQKKNVKLFILAGEASGDVIGADLIQKMRALVELELSGVGGARMIGSGLNSMFPITDLSVMGYVDVIVRLPFLLWRVRQVARKIIASKPDIVVLIDSQVFSNLVAKYLKKRRYSGKILLYVCPTVWGYKPERAQKIRSLYNEVLAILPFEPAVMRSLGGPICRFVGHPVLTNSTKSAQSNNANTIVLMPGSRVGELRRHLPMLKSVVKNMAHEFPRFKFALFTLPHLSKELNKLMTDWVIPVKIITTHEERQQVYLDTKFSFAVAGTATLELAMAGVPMVVFYVMDLGQLQIKNSIDLKFFALPNLILDEAIVPELLFEKPDSEHIFQVAKNLLHHPEEISKQLDGFARMESHLRQGTTDFPRQDPALCVLSHL